MKIFERLTEMLATPGLPRWRVFSLALLIPIGLSMFLGDLFGREEAGYNPLAVGLGGLFFLSQAALLVLEGQLRRKAGVLLILLLFGLGLLYLAFSQG